MIFDLADKDIRGSVDSASAISKKTGLTVSAHGFKHLKEDNNNTNTTILTSKYAQFVQSLTLIQFVTLFAKASLRD